jgi:4-alpha-glucanotransferase
MIDVSSVNPPSSTFSQPPQQATASSNNPPQKTAASGPRQAGLLLPLFSIRTARGWGLGEIADLAPLARWARGVGLQVVQLLPVNEVSGGETSPYSAATAFALDPVYLALDELEDFQAVGGRAALAPADRARLEQLAAHPVVDWGAVRALKAGAIERAFGHFRDREWKTGSERARALERFSEQHRDWLEDYSLWRLIHDGQQRAWWQWPEPLRSRQPAALDQLRTEHDQPLLRIRWLQWQLDQQWQTARAQASQLGVAIKGDLPFMVAADSADVWSHPTDFRLDRSVGTPPDAFAPTGQDWGLPAYDWERMQETGFPWLQRRAARAGALYDLFRVDHVIGFYRTWTRPLPPSAHGPTAAHAPPPAHAATGNAPPGASHHPGPTTPAGPTDSGSFSPAHEPEQIALGERVVSLFKQHGQVIAEDLGMVPEFLPPSLQRLNVPGYRVLRWETRKDGSFRDPARWPALSVATNGTHDIEPNAAWYEALPLRDRRQLVQLSELQSIDPARPFDDDVRDALLRAVYGASSRLAINPLQDLLGTPDRVNVPGTVADSNWSYRMPMDITALEADQALRERLCTLAAWSRRLPGGPGDQDEPGGDQARGRAGDQGESAGDQGGHPDGGRAL